MKILKFLAASLSFVVISTAGLAERRTGTIDLLEFQGIHGTVQGVKVFLSKGKDGFCGSGSGNWAFINTSNANFNGYLSILLAARMSNKEITVDSVKNPTANEFCEVTYLSL